MLRSNTLSRYALLVQRATPKRMMRLETEDFKELHFEEEMSRHTDIREIKKEEKKVKEAIIEKNINRKEVMENPKPLEEKKDINIVTNNTYNSLALGFISTKHKDKYISKNADNFKSLNPPEQRKLFNLFLTYLN